MADYYYSLYKNFCEKYSVAEDEFLAKCFRGAERRGSLSVRGYTLSEENCAAIAWMVSRSPTLLSLSLRDCLPPARGLAAVLAALSEHESLVKVDLAGTNIIIALEALTHFVANSSNVKHLVIKWNNLGLCHDLSSLWNAFSKNQHIEFLDLSSNQLTTASATDLAKSLRSNTALKKLDVRWNQIGERGIEALEQLVFVSQTLVRIQCEGNSISPEAADHLMKCCKFSEKLKADMCQCEKRIETLVNHIKQVEGDRVEQVKQLAAKSNQIIQAAEYRASDAEAELASARAELISLKARQERAESLAEAASARAEALEREIVDTRAEAASCADRHRARTEHLSQELCRLEEELTAYRSEKERESVVERESRLAAEALAAHHASAAEQLREQLEQMRTESQNTYSIQIEKLDAERGMWERRWRESDEAGAAMIQRIRAQALDTQRSLEQTILDLTQAQSRAVEAMSERLDAATKEKASLEDELARVQSTAATLRRENAELAVQATEPAKKAASLLQELAEQKILGERLRQECEETKRKLEMGRKEVASFREEVAKREMEAAEAITILEVKLEETKKEVSCLQKAIKEREARISAIRKEEIDRARGLISAVTDYVKGSGEG